MVVATPWEKPPTSSTIKENGQLTLLPQRKRRALDIMVLLCLYIKVTNLGFQI